MEIAYKISRDWHIGILTNIVKPLSVVTPCIIVCNPLRIVVCPPMYWGETEYNFVVSRIHLWSLAIDVTWAWQALCYLPSIRENVHVTTHLITIGIILLVDDCIIAIVRDENIRSKHRLVLVFCINNICQQKNLRVYDVKI